MPTSRSSNIRASRLHALCLNIAMDASSTLSFGPQQWVQEPTMIELNHGHTYICITKRDGVKMLQTRVDDRGLLQLVTSNSPSSANWTLRLILTEKTWVSRDIRKIPYPSEVIEALGRHWNINDVCFSTHARAGSCSMPFHPVPGDFSYTGIIIRLVYGLPFRGTLAIAHDLTRKATYAVCFGVTPQHAQALLTRLEVSKDYAFFPLHIAYLLTDIALKDLEQFSSNTYSDFITVREAMGTNLYFLPAQVAQAPDLPEMPRKLTALANAAASNCSSLRGVGGIIDTMEAYLKGSNSVDGQDMSVMFVFSDRLTLLRQVVESTLRRNEYLRECVQAQVQMVYALLAQKDNELNHQYGADMRVISIVTLVFLPGTFVATLFSSSFWDFSPSNQGPMVSKWVWLYWVATAVLTIGVISAWMWWPMLGKCRERRRSMRGGPSAVDIEKQSPRAWSGEALRPATFKGHDRRYNESSVAK
ncbi:hypothetical protein BU23DRAFT_47710 [Bimuria novae-zelandiae CBS 107.79]|uniref:Cora-domain-containing protein n=1 Tax=Bimuria novae-zelandiae CBS 107.79 TaxID=1447943 RepID=A0A6A5VN68_9PLEO|nr:hypothetical protein BU23DRAFT_47710 [Bimuria novae-zelandiae CBS 107.79]